MTFQTTDVILTPHGTIWWLWRVGACILQKVVVIWRYYSNTCMVRQKRH